MKALFFIFCVFFAINIKANGFNYQPEADSIYLILDEPYNDSLPRNFRKCDGEFKREYSSIPDTTGLSSLNISGSAEFSDKNLPVLINTINRDRIIVIDLRQESHGFINGEPVSWYGKYDWANVGLTRDEVITGEKRKLDSLKKVKNIQVTKILKKDKSTNSFLDFKEIPFEVMKAVTEDILTKSFNTEYFRITATDHRKPVNEDVDRFVTYISSLAGIYWIHFHCHAGDGRTTTFMVMYDMMRNAKNVSFDDIVKRQYLLGGIDLTKNDDFPEFDKQYAVDRTEFLKKFYEYCKDNNDGYVTSFTTWINK